MASLQRPMLVIPHDAPETVADLSPDVRLRETTRVAGSRMASDDARHADGPHGKCA